MSQPPLRSIPDAVLHAGLAAVAVLLLAGGPALADDALSVVKDAKTPPLMNAICGNTPPEKWGRFQGSASWERQEKKRACFRS